MLERVSPSRMTCVCEPLDALVAAPEVCADEPPVDEESVALDVEPDDALDVSADGTGVDDATSVDFAVEESALEAPVLSAAAGAGLAGVDGVGAGAAPVASAAGVDGVEGAAGCCACATVVTVVWALSGNCSLLSSLP